MAKKEEVQVDPTETEPTKKSNKIFTYFLVVLIVIILATLAWLIFYLIYHPHRPIFRVQTLTITNGNNMDLIVTARNPSRKVVFAFNPIYGKIAFNPKNTKKNVVIGNGLIPSFVQNPKTTLYLRPTMYANNEAQLLEETSEVKMESGVVAMKVILDTKVKVKVGSLKVPKFRVRVKCEGIKGFVNNEKIVPSFAKVYEPKCKIYLRFKIWRWTF